MRVARLIPICFIVTALLATRAASAEIENRADLKATVDKPKAHRGEMVVWKMTIAPKPGFHTYPSIQPPQSEDADLITKLRKPKFGPFIFVGEPTSPQGRMGKSQGKNVELIEDAAEWEWRFIVHPEAKPGKYSIQVPGTLTVCNEMNCVPGDPPAYLDFEILDGPATNIDDKYRDIVSKFPLEKPAPKPPDPPPAAVGSDPTRAAPGLTAPADGKGVDIAQPAATLEEAEANLKSVREQLGGFAKPTAKPAGGLWSFLLSAALWGAVALFTPCVFPMIPITVSFFLHQSEKEHHRPVRMALIYCGTIILVLGISALTLLTTFRLLSINPYMNIALGGLFVVLALSLFGLYEITLPSKLTQFTSAREGRGGVVGTVFMALTFTIVSFTCVAPFLGGFGGMASSGEFSKWELVLGAFVFSTTFASPFFVLALFPTLIKKLPQSGSWLNSVKVVMGFLELAAALKFFRTAELRILDTPQYFTYDLVLGIWVALALITGLYLLNVFRLHHDEPIEHIGVVRMLLGVIFLSFAIYLVPAMFKQSKTENQRPRGAAYAWIDAFLLPEASEEDLPISANLKGTIDLARRDLEKTGKRQFIFVDFTGKTCTNCRYNERTVFSRPDVRELLLKFRLVQLYTDEVPGKFYSDDVDYDRRVDEAKPLNLTFQKDLFGTEQLPLYVTMEVTKEKVLVKGVYDEGKINDVGAFVKFLKDARAEEKK